MNFSEYRCQDHSWLAPHLKMFVQPVLANLPEGASPIMISLTANLFIWIAFVLSFREGNEIGISISLLASLLANSLADLQAQRTNTSLSYYFIAYGLGAFQSGILLMIVFNVFQVENLSLIAYFLTVAYITHAAIFYEQFTTSQITFEKIGFREFILLLSVVVFSNTIEPLKNAWKTEVYASYTFVDSMLMLFSAAAILTAIKALARSYKESGLRISRPFAMFCIWLSLVGAASSLLFPRGMVVFMMMFYSFLYLIGLLRAHFIDDNERHPDLVLPILLVLRFSMLLPLEPEWMMVVMVLYLFFAGIWHTVLAFLPLRSRQS